MMDKRLRSPNYPAISLPEALERTLTLYRNQHTHAAPREVAVKSMGYASLNGASATAISALHKYGLLEKQGDEVKVSERALRIMHPHSPEERTQAIREAASAPPLFAELAERFPGRLPNEELLRNYLLRKGFAPAALSPVILAYRETSEFAAREAEGHDSRATASEDISYMSPTTTPQPSPTDRQVFSPVARNIIVSNTLERQIGVNDLEGGRYVRIVASNDMDTEEALEWAEDIISRKRRELGKLRGRAAKGTAQANVSNEKSETDADENA